MGVRLEPVDEYTHQPSADATFNESMYFNVYDPAAGVGGFFRIGNRVNEAMAEFCSADRRLLGVALCDLDDAQRSIATLDHAVSLGLKLVWIPARAPAGGRRQQRQAHQR